MNLENKRINHIYFMEGKMGRIRITRQSNANITRKMERANTGHHVVSHMEEWI
jgi:hypothetical protein